MSINLYLHDYIFFSFYEIFNWDKIILQLIILLDNQIKQCVKKSQIFFMIPHRLFYRFTSNQNTRFLKGRAVERFGITNPNILRNLSVAELYELGLQQSSQTDIYVKPTCISSTGALVAYSGKRTGRSPKDKRIVLDVTTQNEIWWGDVNIPISRDSHNLLEHIAINYLNTRPRLFVVDGYAGWDPQHRLKIRVFCTRVYHALFMKQMLIRPTPQELERDFQGDVDYHIFNAGKMFASTKIPGVGSETCISVNLNDQKMVILGSQYAGEMKKGVFGMMHYIYPKRGILTLHSSCNEGQNGDVTLLFGLSGTGKTTLSADPKRKLIGDDEHCWSDNGVFNIEGGCYAKAIDLTPEKEPEIYNAIKFGSILENVGFYNTEDRIVNYHDTSLTENTRVTYPLDYIPGAKMPAVGGHPKNIIFLTCDAYGVLPPVSKLTPEQAMYHFISGYTAKVAGTEMGVKEPQATFSACFGEAFLPLHPTVYAEMLAKKMKDHSTSAWLINTGWTKGKYGVGQRMPLKQTRAIIDAIHSGELEIAKYETLPIFKLSVPTSCSGVPQDQLIPRNGWMYLKQQIFFKGIKENMMIHLHYWPRNFRPTFTKYENKASAEILGAGPVF
ncbi:hypothetical protein pb186bvf_007049 [Paramecium bursaria]